MEGAMGRDGGISTCDLTRTRYLSPLSPRKERDFDRSPHRERERERDRFLFCPRRPRVRFLPPRRNSIAAVLNETFVSIIFARRPPAGRPERIQASTRRWDDRAILPRRGLMPCARLVSSLSPSVLFSIFASAVAAADDSKTEAGDKNRMGHGGRSALIILITRVGNVTVLQKRSSS